MYPLRFLPMFQRYLWGGHRLGTTLNKPIGDQSAAESWEIVDHKDGQSTVAFGGLQGRSLHELVVEYDVDLLGPKTWERVNDESLSPNLKLRFPLLFKFLDAAKNLSVQVHPDDALASRLTPPDLGKTEAWYVMDAQPGAKIYAGLQQGVTRKQFSDAICAGKVEPLLYSFEAQTGDCLFIPAGTMHAIGEGLLIAEIQQASNTTYRVFDWNRTDDQGNTRPLHIEEALEATHFDRGPVTPIVSRSESNEKLVSCQHFSLSRRTVEHPTQLETDGEFKIVVCIDGKLDIAGDASDEGLAAGQTILIPACVESFELTPIDGGATLLEISP